MDRQWATLRHTASAANTSMRPMTKPLAFTDNATIARTTKTTNAESETTSSVASALRLLARLAAMPGRYTRARTGCPLTDPSTGVSELAHGYKRHAATSQTKYSRRAGCCTRRGHRLLSSRVRRSPVADRFDLACRSDVRPGSFGWMARDDLLAAAQTVSVGSPTAHLRGLRTGDEDASCSFDDVVADQQRHDRWFTTRRGSR